MIAAAVPAFIVWPHLLTACSGSSTPISGRASTTAKQLVATSLSDAQAKAIGSEAASHLTSDGDLQETTAEALTFRDALATLGERGLSASARNSLGDQSVVWLTTVKGEFYEPMGPPDPATTQTTRREPICSEIVILIDDAAGQALELAFLPADSCSR